MEESEHLFRGLRMRRGPSVPRLMGHPRAEGPMSPESWKGSKAISCVGKWVLGSLGPNVSCFLVTVSRGREGSCVTHP